MNIFFFKRFYLFTFGRGKGREKERERNINVWEKHRSVSCLSHAPNQGPGPQPRHEPCLGIKLMTLWFLGRLSIHWATPQGSMDIFYVFVHVFLNNAVSKRLGWAQVSSTRESCRKGTQFSWDRSGVKSPGLWVRHRFQTQLQGSSHCGLWALNQLNSKKMSV